MQRFMLYLVASWTILATVAWGAWPSVPVLGDGAASLLVIAIAVYVTAPLVSFVRGGVGWRTYPSGLFRLWIVRPALYAQLLLPVVTASTLVGLLVGVVLGDTRNGAQVGMLLASTVGATILFIGWVGSRRLVVRHLDVRLPDLPSAFDGLRIVQLSDLHMGPQTSRRFLARIANAVRATAGDVLVVTGDLIDDRAEDTAAFAAWLDALGPARNGVYLIAGNHDVYANWSAVRTSLREHSAATVLVNDAVVITRDDARIAVVGVGDPAAMGGSPAMRTLDASAAPDLERAFADVPSGVVTIVLAHNPVLWPALAKRGASLTLSGHTHWGQLAIPTRMWSLATPLLEHSMGAYQDGEALLYIHPGTGFWGIPFRIGAYPEIAVITLRGGPEAHLAMGASQPA